MRYTQKTWNYETNEMIEKLTTRVERLESNKLVRLWRKNTYNNKPKEFEEVLVLVKNKFFSVAEWSGTAWVGFMDGEITHWIPLPCLPEGL